MTWRPPAAAFVSTNNLQDLPATVLIFVFSCGCHQVPSTSSVHLVLCTVPEPLPSHQAMNDPACAVDAGDTAWMALSFLLVFLMLPGLILFESGLLRAKNSVSIAAQVSRRLLDYQMHMPDLIESHFGSFISVFPGI